MPIIYRLEKGAPLSLGEIDGNFRELDTRVHILENQQSNEIGNLRFSVRGFELVIETRDGQLLHRIPLPKPQFHHKGLWAEQALYELYDLVHYQQSLYFCIQPHESTKLEEQKAFWATLIDMSYGASRLPQFGLASRDEIGGGSAENKGNARPIPIFDLLSLPQPSLGSLAFLPESDGKLLLIYGAGDVWRFFHDHTPIVVTPS